MRKLVALLALMLVGRLAVAADAPAPSPGAPSTAVPVAPPAKPAPAPTPGQVADAVLVAVKAKDDTGLKALASKDDPDPWLVADELVRRREHDAAAAFATAAPRIDVEALPAYVAAQRGANDDPARRARLGAANAALADKRPDEALAAARRARTFGSSGRRRRPARDRARARAGGYESLRRVGGDAVWGGRGRRAPGVAHAGGRRLPSGWIGGASRLRSHDGTCRVGAGPPNLRADRRHAAYGAGSREHRHRLRGPE